jgi:hypothetical protein
MRKAVRSSEHTGYNDSVPPCVGPLFRAPTARVLRLAGGTRETAKTDDQHEVEPSRYNFLGVELAARV